MKKALLTCLALTLAVIMTGCGPGAKTSTSSGNNTVASGGNSNSSESSAFVEDLKYTIEATGSKYATGIKLPKLDDANVSYMTNTTLDYMKKENTDAAPSAVYQAMLVWKAAYNVDVQIDLVDWDKFTDHLTTAVVSGEAPDTMRYTSRPSWEVNDLLLPLDDKLNLKDPDYDTRTMTQYAYKGQNYALFSLPQNIPNMLIVYNKTKFLNAGEPTPLEQWQKNNWTFTQFVATAKNMTDEKAGDYGFTGSGYFPWANIPLMEFAADGSVKSNIDDDSYKRYMTEVYNLYTSAKAARHDQDLFNFRTTFPAGKDAMLITDPSGYASIVNAAKTAGNKDEFGIAPTPSFDFLNETTSYGDPTWGQMGFSVSAKPKNETAAIEFARLVAKIGANITRSVGKHGILTELTNDDEKAMHAKVKYSNDGHTADLTYGIGTSSDAANQQIVSHLYVFDTPPTESLSVLLSNLKPLLAAQIKEFEENIKK